MKELDGKSLARHSLPMTSAEGLRRLLLAGIVQLAEFSRGRFDVKVRAKLVATIQGLLIVAVSYGFHAHLAPYGIDPHHDGIMFKPALDVAQGKMVFRDTFTQYGGVTVLLQAAALKLFGARLLVIKLQTAAMYALGTLLCWRAWCRLMPATLATLVCLMMPFMSPDSIASALPWSSVYAFVFQGLALLLAVRFMERGREWELVLAGGAAALAFWCRQPVGVFLAGGLAVALALIAAHLAPAYSSPPRAYSARLLFGQAPLGRVIGVLYLFGGGVLLANAIILGWLAWYGALADWWKQSILFALVFSRGTSGGNTLESILGCLFPARTWAMLGTAVAIHAMRSTAPFLDPRSTSTNRRASVALLASTVAVTSWFQYFPIACNYHCYWAGLPMFGVFAHLFYSSHESTSRVLRSVVTVFVVGLVFYSDVNLRIDSIEPHISSQNVPIKGIPAFRGMSVNAADAANYEAMQSLIQPYLRVHPNGTIVTTSGNGLFPTFISRQASYHPMYMSWASMYPIYPDADAARLKYINEQQPMVIGPMPVPGTHVYVGHITWQGVGYNILVPRDTNPTEILECTGAGACTRRPMD